VQFLGSHIHRISLVNDPPAVLQIVVAEVMIYGEDFTQWSETASVEMKIVD